MTMQIAHMRIGAAQVSILNVGELQFDLAGALLVSEAERQGRYERFFARPVPMPVQCVLIQLPQTSVLVDASVYDFGPESPFFVAGYTPPPDMLSQLHELAIEPRAIQHVVFTHAHFDHFNGATVPHGDGFEPVFAEARYYLGRADWARDEVRQALRDPGSMDSRTLGVLHSLGRLELVDGVREIADGVTIVPSPGETPGHLSLRLHSAGETLYCIGDLYHHPVEVEQPAWAVTWADAATIEASRKQLVKAALSEDAIIIATHVAGAGRLVKSTEGVRWNAV